MGFLSGLVLGFLSAFLISDIFDSLLGMNYRRVSSRVAQYPSTGDDAGMAKPCPSYAGTPSLVDLGKAICRKRLKLSMSQEGLALDVGLDRSYLSGVERGWFCVIPPSLSLII